MNTGTPTYLTDGSVDSLASLVGSGPEFLAPSQYGDINGRADPYEPERRLWAAAFEDALKDARNLCSCPTHTRLRLNALEWVADTSGVILSFDWYCDALGFDAGAFRARLLNPAPSLPPEPVGVPVSDWNSYMRAYRAARPNIKKYNREWMRRSRAR